MDRPSGVGRNVHRTLTSEEDAVLLANDLAVAMGHSPELIVQVVSRFFLVSTGRLPAGAVRPERLLCTHQLRVLSHGEDVSASIQACVVHRLIVPFRCKQDPDTVYYGLSVRAVDTARLKVGWPLLVAWQEAIQRLSGQLDFERITVPPKPRAMARASSSWVRPTVSISMPKRRSNMSVSPFVKDDVASSERDTS